MMHGGRADHRMLLGLAERLSGHFQCVLYDQRDCGSTAPSKDDYGFVDLATDARHLLDELGFAQAHVFGTSFGGQIAQHFAAAYPERTSHLVLASTWPTGSWSDDHNPEAARRLTELRLDAPGNARAIAEYFHPPDFLDAHPEVTASFGRPEDLSSGGSRRNALRHKSIPADFRRIGCPTDVIAGREDRLVPWQTTMQLLALIKGARGTLMFDTGHVAAIQQPEALAESLLQILGGR